MLGLVSYRIVCEGCSKCWALSAMGVIVRAVINVGPCQQWECL